MKNLLITVFFLSLTLQLSAETGGSNAVIVEKTTASPAEKTPVYWQKMAWYVASPYQAFLGRKLQRV